MAPRTKEQQIAYNTKRRAETAAKKAPTPTELKAMEKALNKASVDELHEAQRKPAKKVKPLKGLDVDHVAPGKVATKVREPVTVSEPQTRSARGPKMSQQVPKVVPVPHNARVVNPTMTAAYVRNGKPGSGMLRGKNFQASVTFTPEQFAELKDRAAFWNRSLAEQIRWCVVSQMKAG